MHSSLEQSTNVTSSQATPVPPQGPTTSALFSQGSHTLYQATQGCASQPTPSPGRHPTQKCAAISSIPQGAPDYASLGASHNPAMEAEPEPASALPEIDIMPIHIQKDIWRSKDVNLVILLLPVKDRKYAVGDRHADWQESIYFEGKSRQ